MDINVGGIVTRILLAALIAVCALLAQSCTTENENTLKLSGTIIFLSFEGGFYGIKGDDGRNYDPINLPDDFRKDGVRVRFEAKELTGRASYHMWGTMVELVHIQKL